MFAKLSFLKYFLIILLLSLGLILIGQIIFDKTFNFPKKITYGVTFSPEYARFLKLDWQKTYIDILDQLKVRHLRLPSNWEEIELSEGQFDFSTTDFMLDEASKRGAKVILVVGNKQPRWPECHTPLWAKALTLEKRQEKILNFIKIVVERYKDSSEVVAWQVENEPFLSFFGEDCDKPEIDFLKREVALVKSISNKPIIVTDSGELGSWIIPMQVSVIFGTTLYKQVYDPRFGYLEYPILPYLYNIKSQIVQKIFARLPAGQAKNEQSSRASRTNQKTIIVELQTEPWIGTQDVAKDAEKQAQLFTLSKFQNYISFGQKTGFDTIYFWGVEWWYFMEKHGHPEYLEYAKTIFQQ